MKLTLTLAYLAVSTAGLLGCGLDWSLPKAHFEGVDEQGYVDYWEKIGEADLGDGLVIPVHINFNSHRESSSPTLGKGWTVALLESHVEPVDEKQMKVLMPDGWTYTFLRNGNTETWRGNAGWVGETNNTLFTITAPCGWKIRYDQGKIIEITSNKNRTFTYHYNGPVCTEVCEGSKPFVKVESNISTGTPADIWITGQKVDLTLSQRPRVLTKAGHNLVNGFDQSLNTLQWSSNKIETFAFGTADKTLTPTLKISQIGQTSRNVSWNADNRQITLDGNWLYTLIPSENVALNRTNRQGQSEYYYKDIVHGITTETRTDGSTLITNWFTSGILAGKNKKITEFKPDGTIASTRQDSFNEQGNLLRTKATRDGVQTLLSDYQYDTSGNLVKATEGNFQASYNSLEHILTIIDIRNGNIVWEIKDSSTQYANIIKGINN